jgi:integrase
MKRRTGRLFRRGDSFYVSWKINRKVFTKALRDDNGQPIKIKRAAVQARDKFMAPFTVADETAVLQAVATRLEGRKAELTRWDEQQNPPLPLSQAWTAFLDSPDRPDSGGETLYQYECQWSAFVGWMNEAHPDLLTIKDVTAEVAAEYVRCGRMKMYSTNTFNKHRALLSLVFNTVKKAARLTSNPWESIRAKLLAVNSRRELTVEELKRVASTATGELRTLLAIGLYSGMRLGDAATLRWGEVDLRRGIMRRIPNKISRRNHNKPLLIPIHPYLHGILSETPVEKRIDYVLPDMATSYLKRIDAVTDIVQNHFKVNGIQVHRPGTGKDGVRAVIEVGFHSLRHSFVSLCREANAPLSVVESLVGHSNPSMTRHYSHTSELAATQAIRLLPAMTGESVTNTMQESMDADAILREVKAIAEHMEEKNWREGRAALLKLVADSSPVCRKSGDDPASHSKALERQE